MLLISGSWLRSIVTMVESWYLLSLCLSIIGVFTPNLKTNYWWGNSENLLGIPYQRSVFLCFIIMLLISGNWLRSMVSMAESWYSLSLYWRIIGAFTPNLKFNYWWGCSENLLRIPYQWSVFLCFDIMLLISSNWLWTMVSMAESRYLLSLCLTIIGAFTLNLKINYWWGCSENLPWIPY